MMKLKTIRQFFHSLKKWRAYIGRHPGQVASPSIIIFPFNREIFCCGLAGIIAVKGPSRNAKKSLARLQQTDRRFQEAVSCQLAEILSGKRTCTDYLGGRDVLEFIAATIDNLKTSKEFQVLFFDPAYARTVQELMTRMKVFVGGEEKALEENASLFATTDMEIVNARIILLKDIVWSLEKDVLGNIDKIKRLSGSDSIDDIKPPALRKYAELNFLLNCLDRLEVRGRDSAGVQLCFQLGQKDYAQIVEKIKVEGLYEKFIERSRPADLLNGSIRVEEGGHAEAEKGKGSCSVSFTYKTSSIIGELGRNCRDIRAAIAEDKIFRSFAAQSATYQTSLAHTRWASVGSITEENCHPVSSFTTGNGTMRNFPRYGAGNWSINCVLNGDIDNYESLRVRLAIGEDAIAPELTTDTKIIPLQIEQYLTAGHDLAEAFRLAVNDFEGSHAIAMTSNVEPGKAFLALRGSGQSIYVGIAPDKYVFSSELYGLVEATPGFVKMDGEMPSPQRDDGAGQIFIIGESSRGGLDGIKALYYDGSEFFLGVKDVRRAEITTRDIDRGSYKHFFLKEVTEAAQSVHKTLRGKYRVIKESEDETRVLFNLGDEVIPPRLKEALTSGSVQHIFVIGHGTAAVAAAAVAEAFARHLKGKAVKAEAMIASEFSGFSLKDDLGDTLIIPITQSGTTTDTNRAVAMAVERGAWAVAVVNRRQSDITAKTQGVFYTSDGRDVEMSVASTKAFYSQIIAGNILALYTAQLLKALPDEVIARELHRLEYAPALMRKVMLKAQHIEASAKTLAKGKKYWAIVGSGPNKIAADEIRIKLSELCYKTISSDVVENKKHIDLSAEPLIIVCAGGNHEAVMGDIAKDAAIFKAHKASVVVFTDDGERCFDKCADTIIGLPKTEPPLSIILNTLAGHLWGYYAACSIDEDACFFRDFRSRLDLAIREQIKKNYSLYDRLFDLEFRRIVSAFAIDFSRRRNEGAFAFMNSKTISDITLLLKYVVGKLPIEDFWHDFRVEEGLSSPIDLLDVALGYAIDELSRPIDAIKHQAKTVTVGTSRKEQPLKGIIFEILANLSIRSKSISGDNILAIGRVQRAVAAVKGYTLYDIQGLDQYGTPTDGSAISIRERSGISIAMKSRAETSGVLMGTKKTIARTGSLYVGKGKSDGASIVIIPVLKEQTGIGRLLLLHIDFNQQLSVEAKKEILGDRFNDIHDLINEYNMPWHDGYLDKVPLESLLGDPVEFVTEQIKESLKI